MFIVYIFTGYDIANDQYILVCNAILTFEVSETEKCYNYSIIDDSDCELGQTEKLFSVHLGLVSTNDQPIQILSDREVANIFTNEISHR